MANLWRLQKNTDTSGNVGEYCLKNKVLAMGWSLNDAHIEWHWKKAKKTELVGDERNTVFEQRNSIKSFDDYSNFLSQYGLYKGRPDSSVNALKYELKENDLVWMRSKGIYYLARVTSESKWVYDSSNEALSLDASNQLINVEWIRVGDESSVPGAVTTAMIRGRTLQHIWKEGMLEFSQLTFDAINGSHYYNAKMEKNSKTFYNLFSTEDSEDLLCMWLYHSFGYVCIPSTNKQSTELYECVLIDPKTGKHIYPQAKAGSPNLNWNDYIHLIEEKNDNEVWLFRTSGGVEGYGRIKVADPETLYNFVGTQEARNILPDSIINWYDYMMNH